MIRFMVWKCRKFGHGCQAQEMAIQQYVANQTPPSFLSASGGLAPPERKMRANAADQPRLFAVAWIRLVRYLSLRIPYCPDLSRMNGYAFTGYTIRKVKAKGAPRPEGLCFSV